MSRPVAVITGTSRGLGLELAKQLLAREYRVLGVARSACPLRDDGYDVSDYCDIHLDYGTLDDYRTLVNRSLGGNIAVEVGDVPAGGFDGCSHSCGQPVLGRVEDAQRRRMRDLFAG